MELSFSSLVGSTGVALLLIAFFLSLFKFIPQDSPLYLLLNVFGAGLSCYASLLIHFFPFVILEAVWCLVALGAILKKARGA